MDDLTHSLALMLENPEVIRCSYSIRNALKLLPMHYDDLRRHQMTTPAHLRYDGYQAQRDLILASHLDRLQ